MRKTPAWLVRLFLGVMVFFCLFLTAFVLLRANLTFQLADLSLSLETSRVGNGNSRLNMTRCRRSFR